MIPAMIELNRYLREHGISPDSVKITVEFESLEDMLFVKNDVTKNLWPPVFHPKAVMWITGIATEFTVQPKPPKLPEPPVTWPGTMLRNDGFDLYVHGPHFYGLLSD